MTSSIHFLDKGFETEVRKALGVVNSVKISNKDLLAINCIFLTEREVSGFSIPWSSSSIAFKMAKPNIIFNVTKSVNGLWKEDLKMFQHMKSLHVNVPFDELEYLMGFGLEELYVVNTKFKDWESLIPTLLRLKYLYVDKSNFDLSVIKNLFIEQDNLYQEWRKTKKEGSYFSAPNRIQYLYLNDCGLRDLLPLSECQSIVELNISNNEKISNLSPLTGISQLYYLTARYCSIENIEVVRDMKGLYLLNLRHNNISDIGVLAQHKYETLSRVYLMYNPIISYEPLNELSLVDTDIEQYKKGY